MKKIIIIFILLLPLFASAQLKVPELWGHHVHDEAQILSAEAVDQLETMLVAHEDSTSNQIAILIIPSLEGEVLEDYALRVAHDVWKLGSEEKDNGVLLLIAVDDRKMRIEVGYGLEGVLPDAITSQIIRNEIAPHFRAQRYDEGVLAATTSIIKAIANEYVAENGTSTSSNLSMKEGILIGLFLFVTLGTFTFIGLIIPGAGGWFLYVFLIFFYASFPMAFYGVSAGLIILGCYLVGFPLAKILIAKTAWGKEMNKKMKTHNGKSGGSWSSGSGWSTGGSSSSSGGSSGGFSGGGGSFGGGGSSGSW